MGPICWCDFDAGKQPTKPSKDRNKGTTLHRIEKHFDIYKLVYDQRNSAQQGKQRCISPCKTCRVRSAMMKGMARITRYRGPNLCQ